jgi:hypothetical protein
MCRRLYREKQINISIKGAPQNFVSSGTGASRDFTKAECTCQKILTGLRYCVDSALGPLRRVGVGNADDVSEVHAASMFRIWVLGQ